MDGDITDQYRTLRHRKARRPKPCISIRQGYLRQPIRIDEARCAARVNRRTGRIKYRARMARCGIIRPGARAKPRPKIGIHQKRISGTGLAGQIKPCGEAWRISIAPGFRRHARRAAQPAIKHCPRHDIIHAQGLFPARHGCGRRLHLSAQGQKRIEEGQRPRRGAPAKPANWLAAWPNG